MVEKQRRGAAGGGSIRKKVVTRNGKRYVYWEGRYTIGKDPATGKQLQKSISGKTQKEVVERLQTACVELSTGMYIEPIKMTVASWLRIWLDMYTKKLKPSTDYSYHAICETHIIPQIGAAQLQKLSPQIIQQFLNDLLDEKHLNPKTIKNIHGVLHKALGQAVKLKYIRFNPADGCELPKVSKPELITLDDAAIIKFIETIHGHKFENIYLMALFTGMRQGEILGLTWDCVDFKNKMITVKQQLQLKRDGSKERELVPTKNSGTRRIVIPDTVMTILTAQKAKALSHEQFVFTDESGNPFSSTTVYKHFKRLVTKAGFPELRFHDLRHSYAVVAIRAGDDIKTVQENLGHYSAAFTLDVYGYVTKQMKEESSMRMEDYISQLKRGK